METTYARARKRGAGETRRGASMGRKRERARALGLAARGKRVYVTESHGLFVTRALSLYFEVYSLVFVVGGKC